MKTNKSYVTSNFEYLILLLRSVLNCTQVPLPDENVSWKTVFDMAMDHSVGGMLYCAVSKLPAQYQPEKNILSVLKQIYQEQIVIDANLSLETDRILAELNGLGIKCVPLKGILLKNDYPFAYLRTMVDVDILYDEKMQPQVHKFFIDNGYTMEHKGRKDSAYRKDKILHYEMHTSLVNPDSEGFEYFSAALDRVDFSNSNIGKLTPEDTYIYMVEHLANHVLHGGAGIKLFMDMYIYLKNHEKEINRDYVHQILSDIKLLDFEKKTIEIANSWFSYESRAEVLSEEAKFILYSCTFGCTRTAFLTDSLSDKSKNRSSNNNGIRKVLLKVFPPYSQLSSKYTVVKKVPLLYPFAIVAHWIQRLFVEKNISTKHIPDYFVSSESEDAENLKKVLTNLGLADRVRGKHE